MLYFDRIGFLKELQLGKKEHQKSVMFATIVIS